MRKAIILLPASVMLTLGAAQADPNPPGINPEHFAYSVAPSKPFKQQKVDLADQFGKGAAYVIKAMYLCAPVSKSGQAVKDEKTHLLCYVLRTNKAANKAAVVINQFGEAPMKIGLLSQLCVPSIKKLQ